MPSAANGSVFDSVQQQQHPPSLTKVGASMNTEILRLRPAPPCIEATIVGGVHVAVRINESNVIIMHLLAAFRELEKVTLHDLLLTRLVDAVVDAR